MKPARLRELVSRFPHQRLLVIGDLMLDEFIWGKVSRISPEAPVPVVEVSHTSYYPGGAANVARNLREFTPGVAVMGLVGNCLHSTHLKTLLTERGIALDFIEEDSQWQTIVKTRIIARQQHVVRVDREQRAAPALVARCHAHALSRLSVALDQFDAIILEDYGKGFLNQAFVEQVGTLAQQANKILTVDPNPKNPLLWRGATAIKPNLHEAFAAAGRSPTEPREPVEQDAALLELGKILMERWQTRSLLLTLGEHGMLLFQEGQAPYPLPTRAREVFDLSGAGDTAIALFTLALVAGGAPEEAAEIANHAAGVVVGKLGTATLTAEELFASFERA